MRQDVFFDSCGAGKIHACIWAPEGAPRAVIQIVHGIAEYAQRYEHFAQYLNSLGYLVVAEDHMGHGRSIEGGSIQGYFHGGWFTAVEDTRKLMRSTMEEYPDVPYILFGHSMGSFMARTILCKYPDSGIAGAIICGTGWQPGAMLSVAVPVCKAVCKLTGERNPSEKLQGMIFGGYNNQVEHPRTGYDWLNRDSRAVDAYIADPLCGFTVSAGLLRDMVIGISYIQKKGNLQHMNKDLPVLFTAGGADPVGACGDGVRQAAKAFVDCGMKKVSTKLYPMCRHEILNEINKEEVYADIAAWIGSVIG